eukprot:TRINITY_DN6074_c0_g2_i1.p1 TRINITY_DN6074_c0_g2~~TRINITY_DN6074_c0_g2_i1.p1  ORF type:complete len:448 (+),score=75.17 TRINITY_DN6074_c0_g2_i1:29-1345(+)
MDTQDLSVRANDIVKEAKAFLSKTGWSRVGEKEDVNISNMEIQGESAKLMRGEAILDFPVAAVIKVLQNLTDRPKWDLQMKEGRFIQSIDPDRNMFVVHIDFLPRWPTTARDMVILTVRHVDEDGSVFLCAKSIEHPSVPVRSSHVRANCKVSAFKLNSINDKQTKASYVSLVDPGGWIPASLTAKLAEGQALRVANVRKFMETRAAEFRAMTSEKLAETVPAQSALPAISPAIVPTTAVTLPAPSSVAAPATSAAPTSPVIAPSAPATAHLPSGTPNQKDNEPSTPTGAAPLAIRSNATPITSLTPDAVLDNSALDNSAFNESVTAASGDVNFTLARLRRTESTIDSLLAAHAILQKHMTSTYELLLQCVETETRWRKTESEWDTRLRQIEGRSMDADWIRWLFASRSSWRQYGVIALIFVVWPILANVLYATWRRR